MRICKSRCIVVVGDELDEILEVWKKGEVDLEGNKGSCALALSQFSRQVEKCQCHVCPNRFPCSTF